MIKSIPWASFFFCPEPILTLELMLSYLLYIYPELKFDIFLYSTSGFGSPKIIFNNFNLKIFTEM